MNSSLSGTTFILIWFGFLLLILAVIALFLLWGIRTGQFRDQERARSLPLNAAIPPDHADGREDVDKTEKGQGAGP